VSRARRTGFAAHLPSLAALVLAMVAAAASYSVHVDRSASSRQEASEPARPAPRADPQSSGSHAHRKKHRRHHTRAKTGRAHQQRRATATRTVVVTRVVRRRCEGARAPSREDRPAKELAPDKALDPARADAETENAVDRELQELIDQEIPPRAQP
jgi:hypothetical protein